jgi:hypothetical protein
MCCNGIAVVELSILSRRNATVIELYRTSSHTAHGHQSPIRCAKSAVAPITAEKEPIPNRSLYLPHFMNGEIAGLSCCKGPFFAAAIVGDEAVRFDTMARERLVLLHAPSRTMNE